MELCTLLRTGHHEGTPEKSSILLDEKKRASLREGRVKRHSRGKTGTLEICGMKPDQTQATGTG